MLSRGWIFESEKFLIEKVGERFGLCSGKTGLSSNVVLRIESKGGRIVIARFKYDYEGLQQDK